MVDTAASLLWEQRTGSFLHGPEIRDDAPVRVTRQYRLRGVMPVLQRAASLEHCRRLSRQIQVRNHYPARRTLPTTCQLSTGSGAEVLLWGGTQQGLGWVPSAPQQNPEQEHPTAELEAMSNNSRRVPSGRAECTRSRRWQDGSDGGADARAVSNPSGWADACAWQPLFPYLMYI